ncbi:MAG: hypothetical protein E5Y74_00600 [Mesorhizobium sp.]|nr:MAG: hypothetical protein E5Y74_00600 [Mesorhizobium sp.]
MTHSSEALDPYIRQIRDADGDAERAAVLLTAPVFTLMRWRDVFTQHCRRAVFDEGVIYLDTLAHTLGQVRHRGNLAGTMGMASATTTLLGIIDRAGA